MYAVLFDIDGTLIDTAGAGRLAFAEAFAEELGLVELPADVSFAGRSDRAIAEDILRHHNKTLDNKTWERFCAAYCARLPSALDRCDGHVLPGVIELLDLLAEREEIVMGLLTGNIAAGADEKLGCFGIRDRFAFGGFGDERTDRCDIAADAMAEARRYRKGSFCGTMVLGDTLADVHCGRSIEATTVAVATGGASFESLAKSEPDLLLNDFTNVKPLLAIIEEACDCHQNV